MVSPKYFAAGTLSSSTLCRMHLVLRAFAFFCDLKDLTFRLNKRIVSRAIFLKKQMRQAGFFFPQKQMRPFFFFFFFFFFLNKIE